jgi:hypothetical protein
MIIDAFQGFKQASGWMLEVGLGIFEYAQSPSPA